MCIQPLSLLFSHLLQLPGLVSFKTFIGVRFTVLTQGLTLRRRIVSDKAFKSKMLFCFKVVMDGLAADAKCFCKLGSYSTKLDGLDNKKLFGYLVSEVHGLYQDIIMVKGNMHFAVAFEFQIEPMPNEFCRAVFIRYTVEQ